MTRFSKLELKDGKAVEIEVREIKASDLGKCPFIIFVAEHYNADGSCKCHDEEHREMMKRDWEYTDEDFRKQGLIP